MALSSAEFIESFADLATRLAEIDVVTHTVDLRWGSFGGWTLIVNKRHEDVKFTYDGRDSFITVAASPVGDSGCQKEWKELVVKGIDNMHGEALAFVEEFIRKRFTI